jgi:hypothetical protein
MALDRSKPESSANQPLWRMKERLLTLQSTLERLRESKGKLSDFESQAICALCNVYIQDIDPEDASALQAALDEEIRQLDQRITMVQEERGGPLQDL